MVSLIEFIESQLGPREIPAPPGPPARVPTPLLPGARIIPRAEHGVSRRQISYAALQVLNGLVKAGFQGYLVGGGVRDLLLGREPKDFDVATDARPEQVRKIFRNARLIGRRFILAHVQYGSEIVEVATFRGQGAGEGGGRREQTRAPNGRLLADNVYGTLEEDAQRRDFTANALYYNISDRSILDFSGGLDDLRAGVLRIIGDPETRYREDPVRMLRAVRFAAKLGFRMDTQAEAPIPACKALLGEMPTARLFDEVLKLFMGGHGVASFELLRHYGLFGELFPATEAALSTAGGEIQGELLRLAMENTDLRLAEGKTVTPAFLFAALLWPPLHHRSAELQGGGLPSTLAWQQAAAQVLGETNERIAIPKRFSLPMREMWELQLRFWRRGGRRPYALLAHPRFQAAFDFLEMRSRVEDVPVALVDWWRAFMEADKEGREALVRDACNESVAAEVETGPMPVRRKRPRRRGRRAAERRLADGDALPKPESTNSEPR